MSEWQAWRVNLLVSYSYQIHKKAYLLEENNSITGVSANECDDEIVPDTYIWQHWDYGEETKWFLRKTCRLAGYCERQAARVDL